MLKGNRFLQTYDRLPAASESRLPSASSTAELFYISSIGRASPLAKKKKKAKIAIDVPYRHDDSTLTDPVVGFLSRRRRRRPVMDYRVSCLCPGACWETLQPLATTKQRLV